jgi:hypothetical protein
MRISIFFVLTFFLTSTTNAEWKSFHKDELGISYFDTTTIKKHKSKLYLEVLTDYFIPQSNYRILSVISSEIVDCNNNLWNVQLTTLFKEPMGRGKPSNSLNPNMGWHQLTDREKKFCD